MDPKWFVWTTATKQTTEKEKQLQSIWFSDLQENIFQFYISNALNDK